MERRGKDTSKLKRVITLLIEDKPLPEKLHDHSLIGNYSGSRDCHIEPDLLLIYTLSDDNTHVTFERTGTHADLFS
jgi:mRNA interferase YafQ